MRTQEEIVQEIRRVYQKGWYNPYPVVLMHYLTLESLGLVANTEKMSADEWEERRLDPSPDAIIREIIAIVKRAQMIPDTVGNQDSVARIQAHLWMLEDTETLSFIEHNLNPARGNRVVLAKVHEVCGYGGVK